MVDLDELDRLHAALPELCDRVTENAWSPTVFAVIAETPVTPRAGIVMGKAATNAIAILNAWPEVSRELRERRGNQKCGDGACRYRPAEVTFDGKTVTVMNSRDAHVLADAVSELAALRALAEVVKAQCDWAHPGWVPEIREALALVEKAKAP